MKASKMEVFLPDTRGVEISRFGIGNRKIGLGVFTYSRLPGNPDNLALGNTIQAAGTCPGATDWCQSVCYARRVVVEAGAVANVWRGNSQTSEVPPIPDQCKLLRIHVSGDFDCVEYIENWIARLSERPDVTAWCYTRSWRDETLLPALERLRALPNLQLFASVDAGTDVFPPKGWRLAWIQSEKELLPNRVEGRLTPMGKWDETTTTDRVPFWLTPGGPTALTCPEETGVKKDCIECGYCLRGKRNDVVFLEHKGQPLVKA